jgi:N-acylneuraminate cytidylyltransferase/pseudaminic acid cytidylyltransferase
VNIALIIAREGSKRIKNKNTKLFFGHPVIAYSIKTALNSKIFSRIIVSTESSKISKISKKYGAEIAFKRPKKLADDKTSTINVIKHAINKLSLKEKKINICCIYPVAPLLTKKILISGYNKFKKLNADFLVTILKEKEIKNRSFFIKKNGFLDETKNRHTTLYQDAGQFYWGKSQSLLKFTSMFKGKVAPLIISEKNAIDVNTSKDWKKLTNLYKRSNEAIKI